MIYDDLITSFYEESKNHLEIIEEELVLLNPERPNEECINRIFRSIHSLKGTSSFFDLKKIVELSHQMEDLFGEIRKGDLALDDSMIDVMLGGLDLLKSMIEDLDHLEKYEINDIVNRLSGFLKSEGKEEFALQIEERSRLEMDGNTDLSSRIRESHENGLFVYSIFRQIEKDADTAYSGIEGFIKEIESFGEVLDIRTVEVAPLKLRILFRTVLQWELLPDSVLHPAESFAQVKIGEGSEKKKSEEPLKTTENKLTKRPEEDQTIRVQVKLLNDLLNMSGELVLARNQLFQTLERHKKIIPGIELATGNFNQITKSLQDTVMQARMQPVARVFNKFPRIIREFSKKFGKEIELHIEGADVELDRSIIEALEDPLTHLVRNSMDHGIENTGNVFLRAYHENGYVNIDVVDDGRGIEKEKVLNAAIHKGFIDDAEREHISEEEIFQLLFIPGLTTATEVTDLSGRGVGMDVVKTNIEKMGGRIEVYSEARKGTTFRLLLPLTLAIVPSLIIELEGFQFAFPQVNVVEILRLRANNPDRKVEVHNNMEMLRFRTKLLPIVRLSDIMGVERTFVDPKTGERKRDQRTRLFDERRVTEAVLTTVPEVGTFSERRKYKMTNVVRLMIIRIGKKKVALAVDVIHRREEILVKPLPTYLKKYKVYSGSTILGNGKVAMILDPAGIIEQAKNHFSEEHLLIATDAPVNEETKLDMEPILLFKGYQSIEIAVPLSRIARIEEVPMKEVYTEENRLYINYQNGPLRIVPIEVFLHADGRIRASDYVSEGIVITPENFFSRRYVVIPKLKKHPVGILCSEIRDTYRSRVNPDTRFLTDEILKLWEEEPDA